MPIRNGLFTVSSAVHHALMDTQAFATWVVLPCFDTRQSTKMQKIAESAAIFK
ncbi:hypothetical protein VIH_000267 [Vibrio cholerae CT 5369-93]|nr:hypothetical protein VIH_000267 [Vibrio cholerae CT 5369-93]EKG66623.1 hypothetical protein VCCP103710_2744 [Vibrio cholerae CP1037(10)]